MTPQLGVILIFLALFASTYAVAAAIVGGRRQHEALLESARNASIVTWPLLTIASLLLVRFLVNGDFQVEYVWSVTERAMPTYLKVTALWGGQPGSLLFWAWLMSSFTAGAMLRNWRREHDLMPIVIGASMGTLAFFLLLIAFWENPFATYYQTPTNQVVAALFQPSQALHSVSTAIIEFGERTKGLLGLIAKDFTPFAAPVGSTVLTPRDGEGLNPLLRHFGMVIHPPLLYLGFVGYVVPYAFGMAALAKGTISDEWIRATRRWTLVAWLFLSLGLIFGGRWAYDVLGWGGYWGWDPVENASLMPWLTGTAFLHSVMIQEKRGMLRRWNMVLVILTYLQVIIGTFLTRSGVLSSVHAFSQGAIGPLFFLFTAGALIISVGLLVNRWEMLASDNQLDSLLSRETFFAINNFVFASLNVVVAIGTFWPLVTELLAEFFRGVEKATVGPPYFNRTTAPLWLAMLLLMGIAPLVAWKHASARRLGRSLAWPTGLTAAVVLVLFIAGVRTPLALTGYGVALLAGFVTLLEFHRGARARNRARGENYLQALRTLFGRNRRRYGGYTIHLGVIIMAIGVIGSNAFQLETQRAVAAGQTITIGDYVVKYDGLERYVATDGRSVTRANTTVFRDGREVKRLTPRLDVYGEGERMTIPATLMTATGDDLYVLLVAWEPVDLSSATIKIYYNPLINWVWGGSFIFIIGTMIAAWPDFREDRRRVVAERRRQAFAVGD